MTLAIYAPVHGVISLVEIGSGLVVLFGLLNGKQLAGWTGISGNHSSNQRDRIRLSG